MEHLKINDDILEKIEKLKHDIKQNKTAAVAFSGGVDSSVLAKAAYDMLKDKAVAVTIDSDVFPGKDLLMSKKIAAEIGIRHVVAVHSKLDSSLFVNNDKNRCYHCKKDEIDLVAKTAANYGIDTIMYGVNASDQYEHRPGINALKEKGALFPLQKAGMGKPVMSQAARLLGLSNHDIASTTCLASRIPYGQRIDKLKLERIDASEAILKDLGFNGCRVRYHGDIARIEVAEKQIETVLQQRVYITEKFQSLGFKYVTLDLQGYRSGSMNEVLRP